MTRSLRSRRVGEVALGSPPLVTIATAKTSSAACDLNETIDENDVELQQAASEASRAVESKATKKQAAVKTSQAAGKRKRKASCRDNDEDKENNGASQQRSTKRKRGLGVTPLGEHKPTAATGSTSVTSTQESPPIFSFKQGKTALKARKLRKEKQQTHEDNQKRLDNLAAYFANLDDEKLVYL